MIAAGLQVSVGHNVIEAPMGFAFAPQKQGRQYCQHGQAGNEVKKILLARPVDAGVWEGTYLAD